MENANDAAHVADSSGVVRFIMRIKGCQHVAYTRYIVHRIAVNSLSIIMILMIAIA